MAALYDNSILDQSSGASITVGANTNRVLLAFVINSADNVSSVTAVSESGGAMTLLGSVTYGTLGKLYCYYKFAPSTGANTITVTGGSAYNLSVYSYYNTNQSIDNSAFTVGTGNSVSNALTPNTANSVIVALACENMTGGTLSAGTNMGNNQHPGTHPNSVAASVFGDSGAVSGSTTQSASGGTGTVGNSALAQISLAPAPTGPTGVKTFDGVTQSTGIKTYMGVTTATTKTVNGIA